MLKSFVFWRRSSADHCQNTLVVDRINPSQLSIDQRYSFGYLRSLPQMQGRLWHGPSRDLALLSSFVQFNFYSKAFNHRIREPPPAFLYHFPIISQILFQLSVSAKHNIKDVFYKFFPVSIALKYYFSFNFQIWSRISRSASSLFWLFYSFVDTCL